MHVTAREEDGGTKAIQLLALQPGGRHPASSTREQGPPDGTGNCSLAKSEDAKGTAQVPPGLRDVTEARLEVSLRLAIAGPEKDVEPKVRGEAHRNPSPRPEETLLQDEQEANTSQLPEGPDPRREFPGAGVFRSESILEQGPPGAEASRGWNVQRQELTGFTQCQEASERTKAWGRIQTEEVRQEAAR